MKLSIRPVSPFNPVIQRQLSESDGKWHLKVILRLAAGVLSLISFSLFAAAIPEWNANFFHIKGPERGDWQDGLPIAGLTLTFFHSTYHVLHTFTSLPRPHPLVPLLTDITLLILLIPSLILSGLGSIFAIWRAGIRNGANNTVNCSSVLNTFARDCNSEIDSIGSLELGAVVLSCFTWTFMLGSLLLFSAPDVHRWRRARSGQLTGLSVPRDSNYGITSRYAAPNTVELGGYYNNNSSSRSYNSSSLTERALPAFPPQSRGTMAGQFEPDTMGLLKGTQVSVQAKLPPGATGGNRWGR